MAQPISPSVSLAMSMHSQPGVYAILLGSGASKSAGVPTGWEVVTDMVGRAGALLSHGDSATEDLAKADPEEWWRQHGGGELGYSDLLEVLAPTSSARQGLLEHYFEPSADNDEGSPSVSACYQAIAKLIARGAVRVIITTNFDRLMENALIAEGIAPQVVSRPEAIAGMKPLTHAKVTIIKVHGDYQDLDSLNTPEELAAYPQQWSELLTRVFDEYGLIISGWSADWDTALVRAIEESSSRRYPLFWDTLSAGGLNAQKLLALRDGVVIPSQGADHTFTELLSNLEALDRLQDNPLSTDMAVAKLKRYLLNPTRRIDLYDLVMDTTNELCEYINSQPAAIDGFTRDQYETTYRGYLEASNRLLSLFIAGAWHDTDGIHDQLWEDVLQRLVDTATRFRTGAYMEVLGDARRLPALFLMTCSGILACVRGRESLFLRLVTQVAALAAPGMPEKKPAAELLHPSRILDGDTVNAMPRWAGSRWQLPASHLLRADVRTFFAKEIPSNESFTEVFSGFEYRLALVHASQQRYPFSVPIYRGEYAGDYSLARDGTLIVEKQFLAQQHKHSDWPWPGFFGSTDALTEARERILAMVKS